MLDFAEVYDEQLPRVYGYIAYRVANRPDAEDLSQQTFERALAHWSEFDARRASITTWLLAIARNLVIDHQRAVARRGGGVRVADVSAFRGQSTGEDPVPLGASAELQAALAQLGAREQELIALRYGADLSAPQIGALTGLSVANVQQTLSRALRKLRAILRAPVGGAENSW